MSASSSENAYYLAIDGGGSKTLAIIVDASGQERGRGMAGSSNQESVGREEALAALQTAAKEAATNAEVALPLQAAWLGLSGVDHAGDVAALLPRVSMLAHRVRLTNDAELALSALPGSIGVAVIAGTGSIALGRNARGETARAGGWGHVIGDEGSGYEIGRAALQAAVRGSDGRGQPTILLGHILAAWNLSAPELLLERIYQHFDKREMAALAPLVFSCADEGDVPARRIILRAARELALAITTVGRTLRFAQEHLPLAFGGSMLLRSARLRSLVLRRLAPDWTAEAVVVANPALSAARALPALLERDEL